jgi:hypothetical protein
VLLLCEHRGCPELTEHPFAPLSSAPASSAPPTALSPPVLPAQQYAPRVTPLGNKRYIAQAEERVEGPIHAACALHVTTRERFAVTQSNHFSFPILVLTTDELHLFTLRHDAGWRGRFRGVLDNEVLRIPLGAVERWKLRCSILSATLHLFRGSASNHSQPHPISIGEGHGVDVLGRLTDLIAAAARREPAEDPVIVDRWEPPLTRWRLVGVMVVMFLILFLYFLIERITGW